MPELVVCAERLRLLDGAGELVCWVNEHEARKLIKEGVAGILRTKRKVRALVLKAGGGRTGGVTEERSSHDLRHRGRQAGAAHSRETKQNPRGVWTIDRLPSGTRRIFLAVVEDCLAA
ncbi:MAG: hypothetical protein K2X35_09530 [Bryobacteraceae bacterium]|nr:hypothetical protein [Bryobacteraceae bacterium]